MVKSTILLGVLLSLAPFALGSGNGYGGHRRAMLPRETAHPLKFNRRQDDSSATTSSVDAAATTGAVTPPSDDEAAISELASFCPDATNTVTVAAYLSCTSSVFDRINIQCNPEAADCNCAFEQAWVTSCVTSICPGTIAALLTTDFTDCTGGLVTSRLATASSTSSGEYAEQSGDSDDDHDHSAHHGLSTGAIAGIAVGAFVVGTAGVAAIFFLLKRRKQKKRQTSKSGEASDFLGQSGAEGGNDRNTQIFPSQPSTPGYMSASAVGPAGQQGYGAYHQGYDQKGMEQHSSMSPPPPPPPQHPHTSVVNTGVAREGFVYEAPGNETIGPVFEMAGDSGTHGK
ncbi:hypothetical protein MKZ38_010088 [Zalerion maritima]|uniref:Extracellular membrane protein CFEM domain-containing protein n=1 Tax=Zalerion maritima TaxID=339359 RepID=A0AAD5WVC7_9PEZI|nr:hypothetical protein MKZ38_010088 [Zalerion maritima]